MTPPAVRSAVITGATGGIGRWIALGLLDAGFRLFVIGRDADRLAAFREWAGSRLPDAPARIEPVVADLSLLGRTRDAADHILSRTDRLALLVNNAGVLSPRRMITDEGHERTLAVNHLAPYVLTRSLLPALAGASTARIVNVGSSTSDHAWIDPDDPGRSGPWGMVSAYSGSKLALLMTSLALARELEGSGTTVNVVHPGTVATGLVRTPGVVGLAWKLMGPFVLSECQGADTPLHVALSPQCEGISGGYWKRRGLVRPNRRALDRGACDRVLAATERLTVYPALR